MKKWKYIPGSIPTDGQVVYVRLVGSYENNFKTTFNLADKTFTFVPNNIVYPAYLIFQWREL
jgi:hypothetical protein